ncbi:uncharacterized protein M6G45_017564 [Spheniscus humboldti]
MRQSSCGNKDGGFVRLQKTEAVANELDTVQSATAALGQLFLGSGEKQHLEDSYSLSSVAEEMEYKEAQKKRKTSVKLLIHVSSEADCLGTQDTLLFLKHTHPKWDCPKEQNQVLKADVVLNYFPLSSRPVQLDGFAAPGDCSSKVAGPLHCSLVPGSHTTATPLICFSLICFSLIAVIC